MRFFQEPVQKGVKDLSLRQVSRKVKLPQAEQNMKFEEVYEIKELIGKGSFAEVKKCVNRKTSQLFAVKEIHYEDAEHREKVENESEVSRWDFIHLFPCGTKGIELRTRIRETL